MTRIKVRANYVFKDHQVRFIDPLSKYYVVMESLLGVNRLPVLIKESKYFNIISLLSCMYSLALTCGVIFSTQELYTINAYEIRVVWIMLCTKHLFITVTGVLKWKCTERYYNEVNKFDADVGCRPKTTSESSWHLAGLAFFGGSATLFYSWLNMYKFPMSLHFFMPLLLIYLTHYVEFYFYGHLLSLLLPRLRLINYYMEMSLSSSVLIQRPDIEKFTLFESKNKENNEMKKLMSLYHKVLDAYDVLMDVIKWQLLVILISSFICTLVFCYKLAVGVMHSENPLMDIIGNLGLTTIEMVPLIPFCMFGDRVHNEVRKLKELLATRLCENELDKAGRSTARALLALAEVRDLSFSLFNMLQVDVALPFKFLGLLVTYLIILVQFDKVIRPVKHESTSTVSYLNFT